MRMEDMMKKKANKQDRYKALLEKVQSIDLGGAGFWKPAQGRSTVRILPEVGKMGWFFKEVGTHYFDTSVYCPAVNDGSDCPACEVNELLFQAGRKDAASDFRVRRSFWMNVVVRGQEGDGPRIFTPGVMIFNSLAALIQDPEYGDISDFDEGFDIKIDRSGEGLSTEYQVMPSRHPSPLSQDEDEAEEWMEEARDIETFIAGSIKSYDDIAKAVGADVYLDDDYDEDEDDDEYDDKLEDEPVSTAIEKRLARRNARRGRGSPKRKATTPSRRRRR